MNGEISASMMCADFYNLSVDIKALEEAKIEYLHFDIMDGDFVPNYTMGPCVINALRDHTSIPFDIHLMVERPEEKLAYFNIRAGDYVSVHAESTYHLQRVLASINAKGAHPGVVINPATPISAIEDVLDDIDFVLVMTVNPGYAGQALIAHGLTKIAKVKKLLNDTGKTNVMIQVDGNVNVPNAKKMREMGGDIFVAGTSGLFMKDKSIKKAAEELRAAIV